jgi:hypothetical protein
MPIMNRPMGAPAIGGLGGGAGQPMNLAHRMAARPKGFQTGGATPADPISYAGQPGPAGSPSGPAPEIRTYHDARDQYERQVIDHLSPGDQAAYWKGQAHAHRGELAAIPRQGLSGGPSGPTGYGRYGGTSDQAAHDLDRLLSGPSATPFEMGLMPQHPGRLQGPGATHTKSQEPISPAEIQQNYRRLKDLGLWGLSAGKEFLPEELGPLAPAGELVLRAIEDSGKSPAELLAEAKERGEFGEDLKRDIGERAGDVGQGIQQAQHRGELSRLGLRSHKPVQQARGGATTKALTVAARKRRQFGGLV